jgi:hypothetical protein
MGAVYGGFKTSVSNVLTSAQWARMSQIVLAGGAQRRFIQPQFCLTSVRPAGRKTMSSPAMPDRN